jgi:hypothetical protein
VHPIVPIGAESFFMLPQRHIVNACNFAKGKLVKRSATGEMVQKKTPNDRAAV